MQELVDRIKTEGIHVGGGIVKVDGFLNHQVDPALMARMGVEFASRFEAEGVTGVTKVITAEVSGIAPALHTASALEIPVLYARKHRSSVMTDDYFFAEATSRTKNETVSLMLSRKYLSSNDRVIVIDDFLATGSTVNALGELISESGAAFCGIGCVIEKPAEGGRKRLGHFKVPVVALASVELVDTELVVA